MGRSVTLIGSPSNTTPIPKTRVPAPQNGELTYAYMIKQMTAKFCLVIKLDKWKSLPVYQRPFPGMNAAHKVFAVADFLVLQQPTSLQPSQVRGQVTPYLIKVSLSTAFCSIAHKHVTN